MGDSASRLIGALCLLGIAGTASFANAKRETSDIFGKIKERQCEGYLSPGQRKEIGKAWVGKTVIFAPDVIFNDPLAMHKYPGAKIVIPNQVLANAADKLNDPSLSANAKKFMKAYLEVVGKNRGDEFQLPDGESQLVVEQADYRQEFATKLFDNKKRASAALALAAKYTENAPNKDDIVLITDDIAIQANAVSFGVRTQGYHIAGVQPLDELKSSLYLVEVSDEEYDRFMTGFPHAIIEDKDAKDFEDTRVLPNEYGVLVSRSHPASEASVARCVYDRNTKTKSWRKLPDFDKVQSLIAGPRNIEQAMSLDVKLDPTIDLVIEVATGGAGKTFLGLDVAMKFKEDKMNTYTSFYFIRPTVYFGDRNPGALPGGQIEKDEGFFQPILDNITALRRIEVQKKNPKNDVQPTLSLPPWMKWQPWEYIRGISLSKSLVQADEIQNTRPTQMWDIVNRIAEGSKLILQGDPGQIDNDKHYMNQANNGLAVAISAFRNRKLSDEELSHIAVVHLVDGERSELNKISIHARGLRGQE